MKDFNVSVQFCPPLNPVRVAIVIGEGFPLLSLAREQATGHMPPGETNPTATAHPARSRDPCSILNP